MRSHMASVGRRQRSSTRLAFRWEGRLRFHSGTMDTIDLLFADYEGIRRSTAVAQQFEVPTQAERNGDLSRLDPSLTRPITNISPTATALLTYIPLPNVAGQIGV